MTSNDNAVYIREDVFNARMDAFMATIRLENEKLRNELSAKIDGVQSSMNNKVDNVQSSLNAKIDSVQTSLNAKINDVQTSLNDKIDSVQANNEKQFSELHSAISETRSEIKVLSTRMNGLEYRMSDLQNSISWSFTLSAVFIAIIGIIISVFIAFAPSIWSFVKRTRRPETSRNDVKSLVAEQVSEALKNYFAARPDTHGN